MTKKNSKTKGRKLTTGQLHREVLKLFKRHPKKRMNPRQVGKALMVANNRDSIHYALEKLAEENQLIALEDYKYQLKKRAGSSRNGQSYEGTVDIIRSGAAYILCEGLEEDVDVAAKNLNTALHGDKVRIATWKARGRGRREGAIIEVIERASEHFMGTLWLHRKHAMVVPDKINMPVDIFVELKDLNDAKDGDKVIVKVVKWHERTPKGIITSVLGPAGSSDIEMKSILINNGFDLEFPEEVLEEAKRLPKEIRPQDVNHRRDFRAVPTFTIDPADAKDFDDALSLRFLENGHCEVGIHIADVTHYVQGGSALDKEALLRSTSVYLVDRVLPMLPEKISNELCSLRPGEDKCTFSAVFVFDKNEKIVNRWFGKTLIHSDRRFTYDEAQEGLEKGEGDFVEELKIVNKLAKNLRTVRFKKGSIDFDTEEVRFKLDEDGVPIEVYVKERKEAHMLVEEFMLLANREVASFMHKKSKGLEIPFVYRVHDEPNPEKVAEFARFAKEMGLPLNINTPQEIARSFNSLAQAAKEDETLHLLAPIAIRTMAKAEYTTENIGHYGLGFDYYTHFTSPIRRYSDVLVHRILFKNLDEEIFRTKKDRLEEQCRHISLMERKAMDAERESIKYKQVEFMQKHLGEVFTGYISGIIDRGIFVELKGSKCEGMVSFGTMEEPFDLEEGRLRAKGMRSGKMLKMGDEVQIRIVATELAKRQIDMEFA